MLTVVSDTNIEYTMGDSFSLPVTSLTGFPPGATLRFQINSEPTTNIISATFEQTDGAFNAVLTSEQTALLNYGDYIYRMTVISGSEIITEKSGNFKVKWGA